MAAPAIMPLPPVPVAGVDAGFAARHQLLIDGGGGIEGDAGLAEQDKALIERVLNRLLQHIPHGLCCGMLAPSREHADLGLHCIPNNISSTDSCCNLLANLGAEPEYIQTCIPDGWHREQCSHF